MSKEGGTSVANVTEQLRQKYGISAEKSKKSQFLYTPSDSFSDWAFPVRDNEGHVQKDLVESVIAELGKKPEDAAEGALKRFHQTSPEIQGAIKGELCRLAKELGLDSSICGEPKKQEALAPEIVGWIDERIKAALAASNAEIASVIRVELTKVTESLARPVVVGGALLAPDPSTAVVGWSLLSDEERAIVIAEVIHHTPLRDIQRLKGRR